MPKAMDVFITYIFVSRHRKINGKIIWLI